MNRQAPYPALPGYATGSELQINATDAGQLAKWANRFITAEQRARGVTDRSSRAEDDEDARSAARDIARWLAGHWDADTAA